MYWQSNVRLVCKLAICIVFLFGLLTAFFYSISIINTAKRNIAFVGLVAYLNQPTLVVDDNALQTTGRLFAALTEKDPEQYEAYNVRLQGINNSLNKAVYRQYILGKNRLQLAQQAQSVGNLAEAEEYYHQAISMGTTQTQLEASLHLIHTPPNLQSFIEDNPPLSIWHNPCTDIELLGVYVDERDIAMNMPVPLVFIWQAKNIDESSLPVGIALSKADDEIWQWYQSKTLLFQLGTVPNLLPDGGFERTVLPRIGLPANMPRSLYTRQMAHHTMLQYEAPEIADNMVLILNGDGDTSVGLGSLPIPIVTEHNSVAYLVTGHYRTIGEADPRIGIRWLLREATAWNENVSSHVVQQSSADWVQFAGLTTPPINAERLQYWVLNVDAQSELHVDNLGLFPISLPCVPQ